jgi:hypothetical protein
MVKEKTIAKKVEKVEKEKTPKESKLYSLSISLNDKTYEAETDDLREAIQSLKPEFLRTKVILKITKEGKTLERVLYLQRGKMLFQNKYYMDVLINNLIF